MKEPILRAVAMPPRLFWAPMAPAGANLGIQLPMALFMQTFSDVNPLWIVITLVLAHIGIIIAGVKEPHLSKMMESQGPFMRSYKNIYPEKGRKLAS
jgi:hypothetical protein